MIDISIIIPTLNRAGSLIAALESIAVAVNPTEAVEIIVVDNGSTDGTRQACKAISDRFPRHQWRYFYDSMPGLLTGRHRGAKEARGNILSYLDDDIVLAPSWPEALKDAFSDFSVVLAGGPSTPRYEVNPPSWLTEFWSEDENGRQCPALSLLTSGNATKPANPLYIWGLNFAIRKETFQNCGGFNPDCIPQKLQRYQGDGESGLSNKIKRKGLSCLYHPGLAVTHVIPGWRMTPESFEKRGFYQGVCNSYTNIRQLGYPDRARPKTWEALRALKQKIRRRYQSNHRDTQSVLELNNHAKVAGYNFHQSEVLGDAKLLEWVLKHDYFEYSLPTGWQGYLSDGSCSDNALVQT